MAVNGIITADKLKDILYQRQIINDVLIRIAELRLTDEPGNH